MSRLLKFFGMVVGVLIGWQIGGELVRHHTSAPGPYHYEDRVEITGGFYAGRSGMISTLWKSTLGYRSYNVRLDTGELVFSIAEEDLQLHTDQGSSKTVLLCPQGRVLRG